MTKPAAIIKAHEVEKFTEQQTDGSILVTRRNGEKVTLREMTVRDQLAVKDIKDQVDMTLQLLANLTGVPLEQLMDWTAHDIKRLEHTVNHFFD